MHRRGQSRTPLFRALPLVTITGLMILVVTSAFAQSSIPSTTGQAARVPQYAVRLHQPTAWAAAGRESRVAPGVRGPGASYKRLPNGPVRGNGWPLDDSVLYENGPIDGQDYGWTLNFGFAVSDSFSANGNNPTVNGLEFGAWLFPGDVLQSVEVSITSQPFGGTSYFDQTINFTQSGCSNANGFNICLEAGSFTVSGLAPGTYWVNLQNAIVNNGDPVYWDQNSGVGCESQGCPSQAEETSVGTIPSESFTVLGEGTTTPPPPRNNYACPAPQTGFQEIHDFGKAPIGNAGVTVDHEGNVYGTLPAAGIYAQGLLYDFTQRASHWFYNTLYNFLGGNEGHSPDGAILGPHGGLYGNAAGGSYGYGLIYKATPPLHSCANAPCEWNETTIYEFTSSSDAFGITTIDSAGNLYGLSCCSGVYGNGAVFELTPSQGGWAEKLLYSFTGRSDGGSPNSLLVGHDGSLYGTAGAGNTGCGFWGNQQCGVVFELTPSGSGWTERVVYAFTGGAEDGYQPHSLIQDGQGSLFGLSTCQAEGGSCRDSGLNIGGVIFLLSPSRSNDEWQFNQYHGYNNAECPDGQWDMTYHALAMDASGILYVTEGGSETDGNGNQWNCGVVLNVNGNGQIIVSGNADIFENLASDANGNLYGTTSTCGFVTPSRTTGMLWQYSP